MRRSCSYSTITTCFCRSLRRWTRYQIEKRMLPERYSTILKVAVLNRSSLSFHSLQHLHLQETSTSLRTGKMLRLTGPGNWLRLMSAPTMQGSINSSTTGMDLLNNSRNILKPTVHTVVISSKHVTYGFQAKDARMYGALYNCDA